MLGYLGEPETTQKALRDGWYVTGDIATIDADGFIRITDRLSRFSKIAGEMVPHMKVEEEIQALLSDPHVCVVTSVPDATKGERLVALLHRSRRHAAGGVGAVVATSMPKLWLPKREDLRFVEVDPDARNREGRPAIGPRHRVGGVATLSSRRQGLRRPDGCSATFHPSTVLGDALSVPKGRVAPARARPAASAGRSAPRSARVNSSHV